MLVEAKKTKDGYLIPKDVFKNVDKDKLLLEVEIKDEKIKNNYKDLVQEAVWEHYIEKENRSVDSTISKKGLKKLEEKSGIKFRNLNDFMEAVNASRNT